jgi:hypothetical protein
LFSSNTFKAISVNLSRTWFPDKSAPGPFLKVSISSYTYHISGELRKGEATYSQEIRPEEVWILLPEYYDCLGMMRGVIVAS